MKVLHDASSLRQSAIVTGAARGIGRVIALLLARRRPRGRLRHRRVPRGRGPADAVPAQGWFCPTRSRPRRPRRSPYPLMPSPKNADRSSRARSSAFGRVDIPCWSTTPDPARSRIFLHRMSVRLVGVLAVHLQTARSTEPWPPSSFPRVKFRRLRAHDLDSAWVAISGHANYIAASSACRSSPRGIALGLHRFKVRSNCKSRRSS